MDVIYRSLYLRLILLTFGLSISGCNLTPAEQGIAGISALAVTPSNEIEQIFYVGMYDPQSQIPQTVYRIRIHGQASAINRMKFGSGWVKAELVDSLSSQNKLIEQSNSLEGINTKIYDQELGIDSQRKMIAFGPEGFRVTPKDHRLVVVMGSDPNAFFSSVDRALGETAKIQNTEMSAELVRLLFESLKKIKSDQEQLVILDSKYKVDGGS